MFSGRSRADVERQAAIEAEILGNEGYQEQSRAWGQQGTQAVLTVHYEQAASSGTPRTTPPQPWPGQPERQDSALAEHQWAGVAGIAGAAAALGSFLPWITVTAGFIGTVSRSGVEQIDGFLTAGLGVGLAVTGYAAATDRSRTRAFRGRLFGLAVSVLVLGLIEVAFAWTRIQELDADVRSLATIGVGLYLIVIAGAVASFATSRIPASR